MEPKSNKEIIWIGNNKLDGEMTDKAFLHKIEEEKLRRNLKTYGRDGLITVWERVFDYRGFQFKVGVNRYFVIGVPLPEMKGMNHLGKWAVLEYPKDERMDKIGSFIGIHNSFLNRYDFLYRDTLHTWNDTQSLKQMVEEMIRIGKQDIDWWIDESKKDLFHAIRNLKKDFKILHDKED